MTLYWKCQGNTYYETTRVCLNSTLLYEFSTPLALQESKLLCSKKHCLYCPLFLSLPGPFLRPSSPFSSSSFSTCFYFCLLFLPPSISSHFLILPPLFLLILLSLSISNGTSNAFHVLDVVLSFLSYDYSW